MAVDRQDMIRGKRLPGHCEPDVAEQEGGRRANDADEDRITNEDFYTRDERCKWSRRVRCWKKESHDKKLIAASVAKDVTCYSAAGASWADIFSITICMCSLAACAEPIMRLRNATARGVSRAS